MCDVSMFTKIIGLIFSVHAHFYKSSSEGSPKIGCIGKTLKSNFLRHKVQHFNFFIHSKVSLVHD